MKKLVYLIIPMLVFCLCLGACAPSDSVRITVNEVTHSVFYAPFYAAVNLGYFRYEGLEIELVNGGGSDKSMTALLSGQAQFALLGPETAVYVLNEGREN